MQCIPYVQTRLLHCYEHCCENLHSVPSPPPPGLHMPKAGVNMINDECAHTLINWGISLVYTNCKHLLHTHA